MTTGDCISREAAIRLFHSAAEDARFLDKGQYGRYETIAETLLGVVAELERMPPADFEPVGGGAHEKP